MKFKCYKNAVISSFEINEISPKVITWLQVYLYEIVMLNEEGIWLECSSFFSWLNKFLKRFLTVPVF